MSLAEFRVGFTEIRHANLKTGAIRKQSTQNFTKNERSLPSDMHTYVRLLVGKKCFFFLKILRALFSWITRFEIAPFCLITDELSVKTVVKPFQL